MSKNAKIKRLIPDSFVSEKLSFVLTPWQEAPYRLISWWDMQLFSAERFYEATKLLAVLGSVYSDFVNSANIATPGARNSAEKCLEGVEKECEKLSLENSTAAISQFRRKLISYRINGGVDKLTLGEIAARLGEIDRAISREMNLHLFMYIPNERAKYYRTYARADWRECEPLFGRDVMESFPSANCDIDEAGNCFAVARYTACVFHLMRVMENAVQALGNNLGVASVGEKEWQKIVNDIRGKLNDKFPKHQDPSRVKYERILGHLETVKIAWRNPTMHPKATYTEEEACVVMGAVKTFMNDLL